MFEQQFYRCPRCGTDIHRTTEDGQDIQCLSCRRRFTLMLNEETGKAGLVEITEEDIPEPLFMPRGSIRALVTILTALSSWILMLTGRDVPGYVLSLLLSTIGYYFGRLSPLERSAALHDLGLTSIFDTQTINDLIRLKKIADKLAAVCLAIPTG